MATIKFPSTATDNFVLLAQQYPDVPVTYPNLRAITLAQWALESGWGTSKLAARHLNYAGMKWRAADREFGSPVMYGAHDGKEKYTAFFSHEHFVNGYWSRLDGVSAYDGWRAHTGTGKDFIAYIAPAWLTGRSAANAGGRLNAAERDYVRNILQIHERWMVPHFPT